VWETLQENEAIKEVQAGEGVYYLSNRFHNKYFGLCKGESEADDLLFI
jgi:outer membrane scaffolding protein for murein synthesis (MipA/OmpV family)